MVTEHEVMKGLNLIRMAPVSPPGHPVKQSGPEYHMTDYASPQSGIPEPLPPVRLQFSDVMKQGAGQREVAVGRRHKLGDGQHHASYLAGVLQQTADSCMMCIETRGALLEAAPETFVVEEEPQGPGQRGAHPGAPEVEQLPPGARNTDRRVQGLPGNLFLGQDPQ